MKKAFLLCLIFVFIVSASIEKIYAKEDKAILPKTKPQARTTDACEPGMSSAIMDINNVRYSIYMTNAMWWDTQSSPRYEIPAGSGANSLFAGSIWIGGLDENDQLKLAATYFGQNGHDFWPGPLTVDGGSIASTTADICQQYDQFFTITKEIVREFRQWWQCSQDPNCNESVYFPAYQIPDIILNWPAHGPAGGYAYNLAPWWDNDNDGNYNPNNGDFPYYEFPDDGITNDPLCRRPRGQSQRLFGDKTIWWVFNDKGNLHTETGGEAIGLEIRAQTFAFATGDAINNMSFYNYEIINRSTTSLHDTYFGIWTDVDLGNPNDDFTGCDVGRGLGYAYNGDDYDEDAASSLGYYSQPPAIGLDFFEGPYKDADGIDNASSYDIIDGELVLNCSAGDVLNGNINGLNFGDGEIDNERLGMTNFLVFNGGEGSPATWSPNEAIHFYNYLKSTWKDGTHVYYGGTGYFMGGADTDVPSNYMFPGTSDVCGYGTGGVPQPEWSEESAGMMSSDRRFVMSSGPFTLLPGAVNSVSIGAVWARAATGGPYQSVALMKDADDLAQQLFNNCFRIIAAPDAPELSIIETDSTLIFNIYNEPGSNNYLEKYKEKDPLFVCSENISPCTEYYEFQGYQVFQLKNQNVDINDRYDENLVKEIFQCDIKDNADKVINFIWSTDHNADIPVIEVDGANNGIQKSFSISKDAFTGGKLTNNKDYYFTVVAYAYNNSVLYNPSDISSFYYQKKPYLASKNNVKVYKAIPHTNDIQNGGTIFNTSYGFQPVITMLEGHGNSSEIELSAETENEIMAGYPWKASTRIYKNSNAPITVKVIDPLNVCEDEYTLAFRNPISNSYGVLGTTSSELVGNSFISWDYALINSEGDSVLMSQAISFNTGNEDLFLHWGISVITSQPAYPGQKNRNENKNGLQNASMLFHDETRPWLSFIKDQDSFNPDNWIRVGTYLNNNMFDCADKSNDDLVSWDNQEYFEGILDGSFAPYRFTNAGRLGVSLPGARNFQNISKYEPLSSIDLVITSDKSKWTRCCVVEMCDNDWFIDSECGLWDEQEPWVNSHSKDSAVKFSLRSDPSVDKEGNPIPGDTTHGLGWFPGYAIDQRTGERLNIIFGEDSSLPQHNGDDMLWNPTSGYYAGDEPVWGGKHVIYIMGNNQNFPNPAFNAPAYDSCVWIYNNLLKYEETGSPLTSLNRAWAAAMWCAIPILNADFNLLETDVRIKIRVATPFHKGLNEFAVDNPTNDNLPLFRFSTLGLKADFNQASLLPDLLDKINIVPNPFYWGNQYGELNYNNYVKIINLPDVCDIMIYTSSGVLTKSISKNDSNNFVEWDMKNLKGEPIPNGVYIIHVNVPGAGEKILKWFGSSKV
jgi:hypothetical protein